MNKKEQDVVIKRLLYESEVEDELEWRGKPENRSDVELLDKMILEINHFGYAYKYLTDLLQQYVTDENVLKIILNYLGRFKREGITAQLVSVIGYKGNKIATKKIIDCFNNTSSKKRLGVFFDNALNRLQDKRYIPEYLQWLANPEIASTLPFLMVRLARWKIPEARQLFLHYLDSDITGGIIITSIEALSYYQDEESREKVASMVNNEDKNVSNFAKKILKRFK